MIHLKRLLCDYNHKSWARMVNTPGVLHIHSMAKFVSWSPKSATQASWCMWSSFNFGCQARLAVQHVCTQVMAKALFARE